MKFLYLIPARGGSKGIPKKNIKLLGGYPLIHYAIECARKLSDDTNICVSTDNAEIVQVVNSFGLDVPFVRPSSMASDISGSDEYINHALNYYEKKGIKYDAVVLLQPTSPFREPWHVLKAIELFNYSIDMVASVKLSKENPYFNQFEENDLGFLQKLKEGRYKRRQDCPHTYTFNGAVYVINSKSISEKHIGRFKRIKRYLMDDLSSIDIDTELDFNFCQFLIENKIISLE